MAELTSQINRAQKSIRLRVGGTAKIWIIIGAILLLYIICMAYLEISPAAPVTSIPDFAAFFVSRFFPPVFHNLINYLPSVLETVLFAIVGTLTSGLPVF